MAGRVLGRARIKAHGQRIDDGNVFCVRVVWHGSVRQATRLQQNAVVVAQGNVAQKLVAVAAAVGVSALNFYAAILSLADVVLGDRVAGWIEHYRPISAVGIGRITAARDVSVASAIEIVAPEDTIAPLHVQHRVAVEVIAFVFFHGSWW